MAAVFARLVGPARPWLLGGWPETASTLQLASAQQVVYADGTTMADTLPPRVLAAVLGGGHTFDRTAATWLAYTVVGSNVLSVCREADVASLPGTYTVLGWITLHDVTFYQQA